MPLSVIPTALNSIYNRKVLTYLDGKSCHSDIIVPLNTIFKSDPDVKLFILEPNNFSYVAWHVDFRIFAFASGMNEIGLKLCNDFKGTDKFSSIYELSEIGPNWYSLPWNYDQLEPLAHIARSWL